MTAILYIILGIVSYLMPEAVYGIVLRDVLYPDTSYYSNEWSF